MAASLSEPGNPCQSACRVAASPSLDTVPADTSFSSGHLPRCAHCFMHKQLYYLLASV